MPSDFETRRLQTVLQAADTNAKAGKLQQAADALKEAINLDPQNEEIKTRWLALRERESYENVIDLTRAFVANPTDADAQILLVRLRQGQITPENAREVFLLLAQVDGDLRMTDELTAYLLNQQSAAKEYITHELRANATGVFHILFPRGDDTFRALVAISLDDSRWPDKKGQVTAQQDLFRLCEAALMTSDGDHPERALSAMARQLAMAPDSVLSLLDEDALEAVLSFLDFRRAIAVRSQATLAVAKMLEVMKEKGESLFANFVTVRVGRHTSDDLIIAFSAAAAVFPIIPVVAAQLFMTDGFVQQLVPNLEKNSGAAAAGKRKTRSLEQAVLELLSAACVEKNCRGAISKHCSTWLKGLTDEREDKNRALAALVLAKIDATTDAEISSKLSDMVLHGDDDSDQAIEGLAYTSLQPQMKESIARNLLLVKKLVHALKTRPAAAFGCLTIFSNLVTYRVKQSEEQKKISQLKAYANQSKPVPEDPLDNDGFVTPRCKTLLDHDVVSAILIIYKQAPSPTILALVVSIILALAREQKHRVKMTQQGAVKLLLQIWDRVTKNDKVTPDAALIRRNTAHALARLLISVNPAHVFSSGLPATSAVGVLASLLSLDHDSEQRDLLPTFEALLALTNLASMEDNTPRDLLLRTAWEKIEDLLLSPNTLVQRADVELVCNLMTAPSCVAMFADGSTDARRRVTIILALADVDDFATRRAAGGALAMLTEWDAAVTAVMNARDGKGVEILLEMCGDENDEIKHRGFVCVSNVVDAPGKVGTSGVDKVRMADGSDIVKEALQETKNPEVLRLGVEILKKITYSDRADC